MTQGWSKMNPAPHTQKPSRVRKVTIAEIAAKVGVSKATVSFVLNDTARAAAISQETRRRVLETAERIGYRPNYAARSLATGRSQTILMVLFDLWDEHLAERLRGSEAHLVPLGYSLRVCTVEPGATEQSFSEILRTGQADGVLLSGLASPETASDLAHLTAEADSAGVPVVALTDSFPRDLISYVSDIDDEAGAQQAVSHLLSHGHTRIAFLGVSDQRWSVSRQHGYEAALREAKIPVKHALMMFGQRSQTWAYEATSKLAARTDFTAMFAVTDALAIAALAALRTLGRRVPEDCAIIGFDNDERFARFTDPPLTTVDNPFFDAGRTAAWMLLDLINGTSVSTKPLPTPLIIRRSCGCTGD